ncbi:MAG: CBS domain-containing protein [Betaproteobacteria bacterium]|nr:CBS domain-containing protein [Betaproteobacteria bacterium]
MRVQDILNDKGSALFSVTPDDSVTAAVRLMVDKGISSVLVMEKGEMTGLVTLRELLTGLDRLGAAIASAKVADIMKKNPPVVQPDDTADRLRTMMTELHITHVPVMDEGALLGILSFHDIARSAIKDADFENRLLKQYIKNWPA